MGRRRTTTKEEGGVAPKGWRAGGWRRFDPRSREEGGRPTWRKEMVAMRPGSAARTTGGGGGSILDRRCDPFRRRGDDGEVIAGDSGDQMGEADG
jgi:hypothetical protein